MEVSEGVMEEEEESGEEQEEEEEEKQNLEINQEGRIPPHTQSKCALHSTSPHNLPLLLHINLQSTPPLPSIPSTPHSTDIETN